MRIKVKDACGKDITIERFDGSEHVNVMVSGYYRRTLKREHCAELIHALSCAYKELPTGTEKGSPQEDA